MPAKITDEDFQNLSEGVKKIYEDEFGVSINNNGDLSNEQIFLLLIVNLIKLNNSQQQPKLESNKHETQID